VNEISQNNFYVILISVLILIILLFFAKPIKFLFKILFRSSFGLLVIYLLNNFFRYFFELKNICLGLNLITGLVSGLLGVPGIALLYFIKTII